MGRKSSSKLNDPEAQFQKAVVRMAQLYGWAAVYFHKARTKRGWITPVGGDGKGWPDVILAHQVRGIIIGRELKIPPNKPTPEQERWLYILNAVGIDAKVWTPNDWDEIELTLRSV